MVGDVTKVGRRAKPWQEKMLPKLGDTQNLGRRTCYQSWVSKSRGGNSEAEDSEDFLIQVDGRD